MSRRHTSSKESAQTNLHLAATNRGKSPLLKELVNSFPPVSRPSVQDSAVTAQGLVGQAAQIEHDARSIDAAEAHVGVVAAGADRELGPGLLDGRERRGDLLSVVQDDVGSGRDPTGLGPWTMLANKVFPPADRQIDIYTHHGLCCAASYEPASGVVTRPGNKELSCSTACVAAAEAMMDQIGNVRAKRELKVPFFGVAQAGRLRAST